MIKLQTNDKYLIELSVLDSNDWIDLTVCKLMINIE